MVHEQVNPKPASLCAHQRNSFGFWCLFFFITIHLLSNYVSKALKQSQWIGSPGKLIQWFESQISHHLSHHISLWVHICFFVLMCLTWIWIWKDLHGGSHSSLGPLEIAKLLFYSQPWNNSKLYTISSRENKVKLGSNWGQWSSILAAY